MQTYAALVRVSHMGDRKAGADDFHADRDQTDAMEGEATRRGVALDLLPPELDVSGGLPLEQRPSLLAAVEGVEAGRYAGIMVAYLSRLGRNTREQLRAWDRVEAAGGRIVCVAENIDTATPSGRFMRTVLLANAERERDEHVERFDNLKRWATEAGIWQRRQTPLGYNKDPVTRKLIPSDQAPEVVWAFEARGVGEAITRIADRLKMTRPGVRLLLANRVYLGELRVKPYSNLNAHPPIVTREQFEAAQIAQPRPPRSTLPPSPLSGLVWCAGCGHRMTRRTGGGRTATVYICNGRHSGGTCRARAAVSTHLLDAFMDSHGHAIIAQLRATSTGLDTDALRRDAEDADAEIAAYLEHTSARSAGYSEGLRRRENDAAAKWAAYRAALATNGATRRNVGWDELTPVERNQVLRGGGLRIIVTRAGGPGSSVPLTERVVVVNTNVDLPSLVGVSGAQNGS